WVAHDGIILENCLIHNRMNRLANAGSGRLYIRDANTRKYFVLNEPPVGTPWQAIQGLGYTHVTSTALDWAVSATHFVPHDDDVLISIVSIRNDGPQDREVDVFHVVGWCLGDMNYSTVFPGGDFYGIYNNFKKVTFEDQILYANNYCWGAL